MQRPLALAILLAAATPLFGQASDVRFREKSVRQWIEQLSVEDNRARWYATYALGQLGPDASVAVEPLAEILANTQDYEYVRVGAAWALGRIGTAAEPALPQLVDALSSSRLVSVRRNAARALGEIGIRTDEATRTLVAALEDRDLVVRVNAAVALWKTERDARAIPTLVEVMRQTGGRGPFEAVVALGQLDVPTDQTVPILVGVLRHPDADVRRAAARSLGRVGPVAIPALKRPLEDPNQQPRRAAAEALGWMGPKATAALIATLKNDDAPTRRIAARALGRLGADAKPAEAALVETVNDPDPEVGRAAAAALRKIRRGS